MSKKLLLLLIFICLKTFSLYAANFNCGNFTKSYFYIASDKEYLNIHKIMQKAKNEMLVMSKAEKNNSFFSENSFIYAERVHKSGYIEKKYFVSNFSFHEKVKKFHNKTLIKNMRDKNKIETFFLFLEQQSFLQNRDSLLRVYSFEKVNTENYKILLNKLQNKFKIIRFYSIALEQANFESIKEIRNKVLSVDNQDVKYVILARKPLPQDLVMGFPVLKNKNDFKIVAISEAFKMIPYFPYIYYILPPFFARENEWVYDKKQSYFDLSEYLNYGKNSLTPKEYYVSKGTINAVNILQGHPILNFESVIKKGSFDVHIQNISGTKVVKYLVMLSHPSYYYSLKHMLDKDLEKYRFFLNILQEVNSYIDIKQQKNHVAYAELSLSTNKNLGTKYFAIDFKDFDKNLSIGNQFFISLKRKNYVLATPLHSQINSNAHSEQKILEYVLLQTKEAGVKASGKLKIYTTYEMCDMCRSFYPLFKKLRPYIIIEIFSINEKNLDKFYAGVLN